MLYEIDGIGLSHYGAVERGESAITIQKLFQITTALGIPMRHLFSGEPGRPAYEREDRLERLIELLQGLEAKDLELWRESGSDSGAWEPEEKGLSRGSRTTTAE